jgi:hypothetical protein
MYVGRHVLYALLLRNAQFSVLPLPFSFCTFCVLAVKSTLHIFRQWSVLNSVSTGIFLFLINGTNGINLYEQKTTRNSADYLLLICLSLSPYP